MVAAISRILRLAAVAAGFVVVCAAGCHADSVCFSYREFAIPWPPVISNVNNTSPAAGENTFMVVAKVSAQLQQAFVCDKATPGSCAVSDMTLKPSSITPNPPVLKSVKIIYKVNDGAAVTVPMTEAPELGTDMWKADITLAQNTRVDDTITYYLVAMDSAGNITTQAVDPGDNTATCPTSPSWWVDDVASQPADNCASATSYSACGVYQYSTSSCPASYTMNDRTNDVCGEPTDEMCESNLFGLQNPITAPKLDIKGISASADKDNICVMMGLDGEPPPVNDASPMEIYTIFIVNPDVVDSNPGDAVLENAYAMTYSPEMMGADPTLVRVLWDVGCMSAADTANIFDCKLATQIGSTPNQNFQVGFASGSLRFIAKKSGTGNPYNKSYSLIGGASGRMFLFGMTGEVNLGGATPIWPSDYTTGMGYDRKNQKITVQYTSPPPVPLMKDAKCSITGTGGTSSICEKTTSSAPPQNVCTISFYKSMSAGVDEYRLYRSATNDYYSSSRIATIPAIGGNEYTYNDTIQSANLDGTKYYYFLTSMKAGMESSESSTTCTVEDWVAPAAPALTKAATPDGNEKKCKLYFNVSAGENSLKGFIINRDGIPLNTTSMFLAEPGATHYTYTDFATLYLGAQYSYTVSAVDNGNNVGTSAPAVCTPEDLKAPAKIGSLLPSNLPGKLGIYLNWQKPAETDIGGFRVNYCKLVNSSTDCRSSADFSALSGTGLLPAATTTYTNEDPAVFANDQDTFCFFVEAFDNCDTAGTCPSRAAQGPNGSGFPAGGADASTYVKCITMTLSPDPVKPAFPANVSGSSPQAATCDAASPISCKITWSKNYQNSDGSAFDGIPPIVNPLPKDLTGYKVMRGAAGAVPTPAQAEPADVLSYNQLEFTDITVATAQIYAYVVYAVDGNSNFSENGPGGNSTEVSCTPADVIAPCPPVIQTPIDYTETSCAPVWDNAKGAENYQVYSCQGTTSVCNSDNKFSSYMICGSDRTTCTIPAPLTLDNTYTICVTALDESGNESKIYSPGQYNCGECTPSERAKPVKDVTAALMQGGAGTNIYWTNSASMETNNTSASGVNVYRCPDAACSTKTKIKSCADLPADSTTVQYIGFSNPLYLPDEPIGTWYYGVTFQSACASSASESNLTGGSAIGGPVPIVPALSSCPNPSTCVKISACNDSELLDAAKNLDCGLREVTVTGYSVTMDEASMPVQLPKDPSRSTYKAGVKIYLVKESDGTIVGEPATTDSKGNYTFQIDNTANAVVDTTSKYSLIMRIPAADKAGLPCTKPSDLGASVSGLFGTDCGILLAKKLTPQSGTPLRAKFGFPMPAKGQGRSEIGNLDCDNTVGLKDFTIFKQSYKIGRVSEGAEKYADINQDGYVNLTDFLTFKHNMGKVLDAAPTFVPDLCKP